MQRISMIMRVRIATFLCLFLFPMISTNAQSSSAYQRVCFSPEGHCIAIILDELGKAKRFVRVQAYSFTSREIAAELIVAAKRGVSVEVIVDKSQLTERYSILEELRQSHIPVYVDHCCAIAHNKVMIIDGLRVITGSYNFSKAAELKNAENLLVLEDASLAAKYLENWTTHQLGSDNVTLK